MWTGQALRLCLQGTGLEATEVAAGSWAIGPGKALPAKQRQLTGLVRDQSTGEALPYASLLLKGRQEGTVSDEQGNFFLAFTSASKDTLRVRYLGYQSRDFPLDQALPDIILLRPLQHQLEKMIDRSNRY